MESVIYPVICLEKWKKAYGLQVETGFCPYCSTILETTLPYATKKFRGLVSPEHTCSFSFFIYTQTEAPQRKHRP